jgi:hypothetical protein
MQILYDHRPLPGFGDFGPGGQYWPASRCHSPPSLTARPVWLRLESIGGALYLILTARADTN